MILLQGATKAYGPRLLFENLNWQLPQRGIHALLGGNGAGKSTLLSILAGEESLDGGELLHLRKIRLGYLSQFPNPRPKASIFEEARWAQEEIPLLEEKLQKPLNPGASPLLLRAYEEAEARYRLLGGYSWKAKVASFLKALGFPQDSWEREPSSLSGGERMRLELVRVLLQEPELLLLDEPSNHLDLEHLAWFEEYLGGYKGCCILISHDESLLQDLPQSIFQLKGGKLSHYKGNLEDFRRAKEQEQEALGKKEEAFQREKERLSSFIQRFGAKASKAASAQSKAKQLAKLEAKHDGLGPVQNPSLSLPSLPRASSYPSCPLKVEGLQLPYGPPREDAGLSFQLAPGQRLAVLGPNGVGKSTLLKAIQGLLKPLSGKIWLPQGMELSSYAQDQGAQLKEEQTALECLLEELPQLSPPKARSILGAFAFSQERAFEKIQGLFNLCLDDHTDFREFNDTWVNHSVMSTRS